MTKNHAEKAIEIFGTTYYKTRAGFMLTDGKLLDLTDQGSREDHRVIQDAFDDEEFEDSTDYLIAFMNEGNIRLIPEIPAIDLVEEPTDQQYNALRDYISFWIGRKKHFEVQFSNENGDQVDWKEYNGFTSEKEVILDIKEHFSESLDEQWDELDDYRVSDLIGTDTLYHATYQPYWEEIKKFGRIKPGVHSNWGSNFQTDQAVYLSRDFDDAVDFAETAESTPQEYLKDIVVLEIDANKLDFDLLDIDRNQAYGYNDVNVEDPLSWVEFSYSGPIPVSYIKAAYNSAHQPLDSKSSPDILTEVYPLKNETKSDFINRFMRATAKEYPNVKQRYAVANSYWERRNLKESIKNNKVFNLNKTGVGKYDQWLLSQDARNRDNVNLEIRYMTPREYFEACGELFGNNFESQVRQIKYDDKINKELEKVYDSNQPMNLTVLDYVSRPNTQEGRHRMYVLADKYGWDQVSYPVAVFTPQDPERADREELERQQEKLYKYIDRSVLRASDFSYRNYDELKEQLEYYLEDYIDDPKVEISERGRYTLAIIVNGLEYEVPRDQFLWETPQSSSLEDTDLSELDLLDWDDFDLD